MRRFRVYLSLLLVLYGCGSEEGFDENQIAPRGFLRIVHAIPEAPEISSTLQIQRLGTLDYGEFSTNIAVLPDIDREFNLTYYDGDSVQDLLTDTLHVEIDYLVTVVIAGTMAEPQLIIVEDPSPVIEEGSEDSELLIVHASSQAPSSIDLFLTTGDDPPAEPRTQLSHFQATEKIVVPPNAAYRLRYASTGTDDILWDSGEFEIMAQTQGLMLITDHSGPGSHSGRILPLASQNTLSFPSEELPSAARFANMMADAPDEVDFYINDQLTETGIQFQETGGFHDYASAEIITVKVTETDTPENVYLERQITLHSGNWHTITIYGPLDDARIALSLDHFRRIQNRVTLSLNNYSPSLGNLNAYVVPPGENYTDLTPINLLLGTSNSGILYANDYDLTITPADSQTIDSGPHPLSMPERGIYRVDITDSSGGGRPSIIVTGDDFTTPSGP